MARQVLNGIDGSATWSGINTPPTKPLPILVSTGRTALDGDNPFTPNGTIFEFSEFEFGSWDTVNLGAFVQTQFMGTPLQKGWVAGPCVNGLDNAAFVLGASSLAITGALITLTSADFTLQELTANIPNSFCGLGSSTQTNCSNPLYSILYLDDGGDGLQNIPLVPLLQPARNLDTIISIDSSDDTGDGFGACCGYNWPQAYSINATRNYALSKQGQAQGIAFPNTSTMPPPKNKNLSLVYTPTFYGCDSLDTTLKGVKPPLIINFPNAPYTAYSNGTTGSTITWEWGDVVSYLIANGQSLATTGIPGLTPYWSVCLACAVTDRARERAGLKRSADCQACFTAYCADKGNKTDVSGLVDSNGYYSPPPLAGAQGGSDTYCYAAPVCYWEPRKYVPPCNNAVARTCYGTLPTGCEDWYSWDTLDCDDYGIGVNTSSRTGFRGLHWSVL
jgi:lysophospholipase